MSAPTSHANRAARLAALRRVPAGAARMSRTWIDHTGTPRRTDYLVPVDAADRRTAHVRHVCRGHIEVDGKKQQCDKDRWIAPEDVEAGAGFCPDHGCKLEAEVEKTPWVGWADMRQSLAGKPLALIPLAGVAAAGVAEQVCGVPAWQVAIACPTLAGSAWAGVRWWLTRKAVQAGKLDRGDDAFGRRTREKIGRRARHAGYSATAATAWAAAYAATAPDSPVGIVAWPTLVASWAVAARPWWAYVDARRPQPTESEPEPEVVEKPTTTAGACAAEWAEHVGIPNTTLDTSTWKEVIWDGVPCGWQAVITATKRGALMSVDDNMVGMTRKIASGFDVPVSSVTIIAEYRESPNSMLVLVQPNNPLRDGQIWRGPESIKLSNSRITAEVGRHMDGSPMMETLYRFAEGMPAELVLGTTGSGKSERLRLKLLIQRWASFVDAATGQRSGLFLSFLHDPKRLNSYGEFRNALHGYGLTRDDAHIMIDAFLREMVRRYDMLRTIKWVDPKGRSRVGSVKWDPRIHGPLISVIWDEFHELASDEEFVKKLEKLARYVRACGMGNTLASHMGTLGDTGSQALRDMLAGGRATLLRTTSGLNAALATGGQLTADPRSLQKIPGMALVADGETQTIVGRYAFVPDDVEAEKLGERPVYDWLFDDDNNPIGYPAVIPSETAEAFGPEFMQWCAAGMSEAGRDAGPIVATDTAPKRPVDGTAMTSLLACLASSSVPLGRQDIIKRPAWGKRGVTSTLSDALKRAESGVEQSGPLIEKHGSGRATTYSLTQAGRRHLENDTTEQMQLELAGA